MRTNETKSEGEKATTAPRNLVVIAPRTGKDTVIVRKVM